MRFPYNGDSSASLMPQLTLTLEHNGHSTEITGLVDSGSTVNVLPYSVGSALGVVWDKQPMLPPLGGSLSNVEVRALSALASHSELVPDAPVQLVFAWAVSDKVPIIFGQMNFFLEFNVCFYRSEQAFEVSLKR
jgi:hypothetical protein